ncbi:hypothetical protein ACQPXH_02035 [Nocardia sp. CA-135953]|uniref:hypothetical protein n=1 Tax=Nocardia sp. CA-135953 TaxID=3239978 RepID=UPI003D979AAD
MRLAFAGAIALLLWRASLRVDRAALPGIIGLGVTVAGMNLCFYAAIERASCSRSTKAPEPRRDLEPVPI